MKLTLKGVDGESHLVTCQGEVTRIGVGLGRDPLAELLGPGVYRSRVLLSLEDASQMDSSGIAWLVNCNRRFNEAGGMLVIHSVPPTIMELFALLHLPKVLHLAEDLAKAKTVGAAS